MSDRRDRITGPRTTTSTSTLAAFAIASAILTAGGAARGQCAYEVTAIIESLPCAPPFFNGSVMAQAINNNGHVVGFYENCITLLDDGFVWTPETGLVLLPKPPGVMNLQPEDINDAGVICGTWTNSNALGSTRGFVWWPETQTYTELDTLSGSGWGMAHAISNNNVVVGERSNGKDVAPRIAFAWSSSDGFSDIWPMNLNGSSLATDVSDDGVVAGIDNSNPPGQQAFRWYQGKKQLLGPIPGGITSRGRAISRSGTIVGAGNVHGGATPNARGFIWRDGTFTVVEPFPGHEVSSFDAISDGGVVLGISNDLEATREVVIWRGGSLQRLHDIVTDDDDLVFEDSRDINDHGQILVTAGSLAVVINPPSGSSADVNDDCHVNVDDLLPLLELWGTASPAADIDGNARVDVFDLLGMLSEWTG